MTDHRSGNKIKTITKRVYSWTRSHGALRAQNFAPSLSVVMKQRNVTSTLSPKSTSEQLWKCQPLNYLQPSLHANSTQVYVLGIYMCVMRVGISISKYAALLSVSLIFNRNEYANWRVGTALLDFEWLFERHRVWCSLVCIMKKIYSVEFIFRPRGINENTVLLYKNKIISAKTTLAI